MAEKRVHGICMHDDETKKLSSMTNKFKFRFIARKSKSENYVLIGMRVTINGTIQNLGLTGVKCLEKTWDAKNQRLKGSFSNENRILEMKKSDALNIYYAAEERKEYLTADIFKKKFNGEPTNNISFKELSEKFRLARDKKHSKGTIKSYKLREKKIVEFLKDARLLSMPCEKLTIQHMNQCDEYLSAKYGNVYVGKILQYFKTVLLYGNKLGLINSKDINNFKVKIEYVVKHSHLELEEVKSIEHLTTLDEEEVFIKDAFVFCCYTGLEISAIQKLRFKEDIVYKNSNYILFQNRTKTKTERIVPLHDVAISLFKKYSDFDKFLLKSDQYLNRTLKIIAAKANINRKVVWHDARKTFANLCINHFGLSLEATAIAMGHCDTKELKPYSKVRESRILLEFQQKIKNAG